MVSINNYPYDILGNIAIVKFPENVKAKDKKQFAAKLLKENKAVKTILEKIGKFKGRLRKQETKHVAGVKSKEVLYKENGCIFRFNVDSCYFSPRLSNERKEIASQIRQGDKVLVMFAGVAPFSIVIAKTSKAGIVYSNEINREANKYAKLNIELNKVKDKVVLIPGDIKKVAEKIKKLHSLLARDIDGSEQTTSSSSLKNIAKMRNLTKSISKQSTLPTKFDVIVMPRPQLKDSFLKQAFVLSKKGTKIFYYDFCKADEINKVVEKIKQEAKQAGRKIKILKTKPAGEIGVHKFRVRVDFRVL